MVTPSGQRRVDSDHEKAQPSFQVEQYEDKTDFDPLGIIKERLIAGEDVMVSGFGKWSVKDKRERRGRNPQTGDELLLDARRVVTWHYSPVLKKALNG
jgi:nucleoid DNA-binding protein